MRNKILASIALVMLAAVTLTGCSRHVSLQERAEYRDQCEALGGEYEEYFSGWDYSFQDWECFLDTKE